MKCFQCKYVKVCMAQADMLGQVFDVNYDGEYGCTDFTPFTNADRIRAMSDEELGRFLATVENRRSAAGGGAIWKGAAHAIDWLKQPAKEVSDDTT